MRSVLVIFRDAKRAAVEAYLNATLVKNGREWRECDSVFVGFYSDAAVELDPELLHEIRQRTGSDTFLSLIADISGRIPGDAEALSFCDRFLSRFEGWAMDDYTNHLWALDELRSKSSVQGHGFFDYAGWRDEKCGPNKSSDRTASSVTPPAPQEPRH